MTASPVGPARRATRRFTTPLLALGTALSLTLAGCWSSDDEPDPLRVETDAGAVRGSETATSLRFAGIPYAAPPTGANRWKAPAAVTPWTGERLATDFAPHCAQPTSPYGVASTSEDCLYLNVYRPKTAAGTGPFPVMVWIHGGAFYLGQSDGYDPARLVPKNVVVVTLNYRLGALGFLAHPALSAEQSGKSGNYGLMDQQAALRWVKANIGKFGGDAGNVTIFGESAGGFSVLSHVASAGSAGLFHKAAVMSGAYPFSFGQATQAQAEALGTAAATAGGCAAPATAACLRGLTVAQLLTAQATAYPSGPIPHVDGNVLSASVRDTLVAGTHNKVPMIEGTTHDEWRLFVAQGEMTTGAPLTAATYVPTIVATLRLPEALAGAMAAGPYNPALFPNVSVALGALGTDAVFACSGRAARKLLSARSTTYAYEFSDASAPQVLTGNFSFSMGASHTAELQYLWVMRTLTTAQTALADQMVGYWTEFARTGNPNAAGSSTWAAYSATSDAVLTLNPGAVAMNANFNADHKCSTIWTPGV